jgi:hypothetical protein
MSTMPHQFSTFFAGAMLAFAMLVRIALPLAAAGGCSSAHKNLGSNRVPGMAGDRDSDTARAGSDDSPSKESVAGSGSTPIVPRIIDETGPDNPAGLSAGEVTELIAGGPPGKLRWLYPYDGTVFPRGTRSPALMWEGDPDTDVVYLRMHSRAFDYKTILRAELGSGRVLWTNPMQPQVRVPQQVWEIAGQQTRGKTDPFSIELSTRVRGVVAGPVVSRFIVAPASI